MNKDIYVIYHPSARTQALVVQEHLKVHNIGCEVPSRESSELDVLSDTFSSTIKQYKAVILILSDSSQHSDRILDELNIVLDEKIPLLPVMFDNFALTAAFNFMLSNVQRFEAFRNLDLTLFNLVNEVYKILGIAISSSPDKLDGKTHNSTDDTAEDDDPPKEVDVNQLVLPEKKWILPIRILLVPFVMLSHLFKKDDLSLYLNVSVKIAFIVPAAIWLIPALVFIFDFNTLGFLLIPIAFFLWVSWYISYNICLWTIKKRMSKTKSVWTTILVCIPVNFIIFAAIFIGLGLLSQMR